MEIDMKKMDRMIYFLDAFSMGLLVPVMSLVYLTHGAKMENISLFVSVIAVTIVIAELPSGVIADLIGRKKIFLWAHVFRIVSYVLLIFWKSPITLLFSMIFRGIAMAFSSGSFEALLVEQYVREAGEEAIPVINKKLLQMDCVGSATAAILGGVLAAMGDDYSVLLIFIAILDGILLVLSYVFITENWVSIKRDKPWMEMKKQINLLRISMKQSKSVRTVLFLAAVMGGLISTVEIYWQQSLTIFLPDGMTWILGFVSCMVFFCTMIGSQTGEKMIKYKENEREEGKVQRKEKYHWLFRILLTLSIGMLGCAHNAVWFIAFYGVTYFISGVGDLCERTILHESIENEYRASMLSVYSLFIRGGALLASIVSSCIISCLDVKDIWFAIPMITLGCMGCYLFWKKK